MLREDQALARLPVVMLTARADERDQIRGWQLGVTDFVTKPFDAETLVAAVREALRPPVPRSASAAVAR